MPRLPTLLLLFLPLFASMCCCLEGRKLHIGGEHNSLPNPSSRDTFYFTSLPKGTVPSSTPSKKGHAMELDDKLVARHLITTERLLLRSVPSPGAGH